MAEIKLEPFATTDTAVAGFVAARLNETPEIIIPKNPFLRRVNFSFRDGRRGLELAEQYLRDHDGCRTFFERYSFLKRRAIESRQSLGDVL